jgi:transcription antitermination factor NusG
LVDSPSDRWFVVRTEPNRERWAAENVARAGHTFYLPEIFETCYVKASGNRQRASRRVPLFRNYLFVKTDGQWHFLRTLFGIVDVVRVGPIPATLMGNEIMQIRRRESGGVVVLPPKPKFVSGQQVRIKAGAFGGRIGLYSGASSKARAWVLLAYLERKVSFLLPESALEAA